MCACEYKTVPAWWHMPLEVAFNDSIRCYFIALKGLWTIGNHGHSKAGSAVSNIVIALTDGNTNTQ